LNPLRLARASTPGLGRRSRSADLGSRIHWNWLWCWKRCRGLAAAARMITADIVRSTQTT